MGFWSVSVLSREYHNINRREGYKHLILQNVPMSCSISLSCHVSAATTERRIVSTFRTRDLLNLNKSSSHNWFSLLATAIPKDLIKGAR